jgi:hypothetical protein
MFKETPEGLTSRWTGCTKRERKVGTGAAVPLIAPNRDGIAYGTVGSQMILKRQKVL